MATIVIHSGRPKTGSTSIQQWIAHNATRLRDQHGIQVVVARRPAGGYSPDRVRLEPYEAGAVHSKWLIRAWFAAQQPVEIPRRFVEELARWAETSSTVLVTTEWLSQAFAADPDPWFRGLQELTSNHHVRIGCYVRPQHTAIEAAWCQGGYRTAEIPPSEWVTRNAQTWLDYESTSEDAARLAPGVNFGVRPFRMDLLDGENPVEDFVRRSLRLDEECRDVHANPSLPLEFVNLLRDTFDDGSSESLAETRRPALDDRARAALAELFDGLRMPDSSRIRRSRLILQQHCHDLFEEGNRELIRRLGWPIAHFVAPADGLEDEWSLAELDELWRPEASLAERALLRHAARAAVGSGVLSRASSPTELT